MCGIAGIIGTGRQAEELQSAVKSMTDRIRHRGPDGEGNWVRDGVALGHRRLAIIDVAGGQQPCTSQSGQLILSFNGEIYNYRALRAELQAIGFKFGTQSDTEVLANAWEAWGEKALLRIEGMYAFALWDNREECLWLARDRVGIKPCYYSFPEEGLFTFASELKGLLACPLAGPSRLRADALVDYLTLGYIPLDKSILQDTYKLLPGEVLAVGRDAQIICKRQFWSPTPGIAEEAEAGAVEPAAMWSLVADSVHKQTVADVPVATFLSGGVDSSTVTAAMKEMSDSQVTAYSIGVGGGGFDETAFASQAAAHLGLDHRLRRVDIEDALDPAGIAQMYDEPYADSSAIPTSILCQFAAESHKVALSGDGGDECFFGYTWYRSFLRRRRLQNIIRKARLGSFLPVIHKIGVLAKKHVGSFPGLGLLTALQKEPVDGYLFSQSISPFINPTMLLSETLRGELQGYATNELFAEKAEPAKGGSTGAVCRLLDFHFYLPGDILTKVDRAAMAHSLEVRVPLLDEAVVDATSQLSAETLMRNDRLKGLLIDAARPHLPEDILERRKMGFSVPLDKWFRAELGGLFKSTVFATEASTRELLDQQRVEAIFEAHQGGDADCGSLLWAILQLELSLRTLRI